jgi:signal transduction histidine kinase
VGSIPVVASSLTSRSNTRNRVFGDQTRFVKAVNVAPVDTVAGVRRSLWRAAVVYRIFSAAFALYLIVRWLRLYQPQRQWLAVLVGVAIVAVTSVVAVVGLTGRANRAGFVLADLLVTVGLTLLTPLVQTHSQAHGSMPTLTTIWAAGPVIEAGLVGGWLLGAAAALTQFAATIAVHDGYDGRTLSNGFLLLLVGPIAGYVCGLTVRAEQMRAEVSAREAQLTERERLARSIHDGVLQVLGLMHRKGEEAGGEWAELGRAAAEQEAALRGLITARAEPVEIGMRDIVRDLAALRSPTVTVSVPATAVLLLTARADELLAVVNAALHNVRQHAGGAVHAWILLEDMGDQLTVTVRDDGVGMAADRLDQAEAAGRIGVARSMRGRAADLGGTVVITSAPGAGTEVEVVIPKYARTG